MDADAVGADALSPSKARAVTRKRRGGVLSRSASGESSRESPFFSASSGGEIARDGHVTASRVRARRSALAPLGLADSLADAAPRELTKPGAPLTHTFSHVQHQMQVEIVRLEGAQTAAVSSAGRPMRWLSAEEVLSAGVSNGMLKAFKLANTQATTVKAARRDQVKASAGKTLEYFWRQGI